MHLMYFAPNCCSVGLWNAFYVILYAIGNATKLMRYSTRSNTISLSVFDWRGAEKPVTAD